MEISETKKPNKYAALVTYLVAIVCLLLGLFLPLFNGNGILALYLPDVFNHISGNEAISVTNKLDLAFTADIFGTGATVDLMAYVILLYAVVTVLGLLALIPIGITFNGESKVPYVLEYIVTVAASLVLSLYVVMALQLIPDVSVSINMMIAFGGSILALAALSVINKKASGAAKIFLCFLSAVAVFLLFDLTVVIPQLKAPLDDLGNNAGIFPAMLRAGDANIQGITYFTLLVAGASGSNFTTVLISAENVAQQITYCVAVAAAIIVLLNYFIDIIGLSSNAKKAGLLFNFIRFALAALILILLIIMIAASKSGFGLFAVILAVVVILQLLFSILRFFRYLKKVNDDKTDEDFANQTIKFAKPVKQPKQKPAFDDEIQDIPEVPSFVGAEPIVSEPIVAETIEAPQLAEEKPEEPQEEQMTFIEPAPEVKEEEVYEEPVHEHPGEVQMEMEEVHDMPTVETVEETAEEAYYVPDEQPAGQPEGSYENQEPEETEAEYEQSEEAAPVQTYEVQPEEVKPGQAVEEADNQPAYEQPVYEQPPYAQPAYTQPVYNQPVYEQPAYEQPYAQPVYGQPYTQPEVPVFTQPAEPAPVEKIEKEEPAPAPAPAPVREEVHVREEVPVRIEIQPVQERPARPFIDKRIYTEMYEQTDSFIDKLTETEKIEFTRTFIEKANGDIGNIPEYVIGGSNKKFFSAVFIYLGRIRGMISDGLLNKMFKELNML